MDRLFKAFAPKLKNITDATKQIANQTKDFAVGLNKQPKQPQDLIQITPRIYWMDFPSSDKIQKLAQYLNTEYCNNYYIWNVGERSFPTEWFQHQVASHSHPGYPCPPLMELLMICKNILYFLGSDKENIAVICCQESRGRSIMVLSSLLSIMGVGHPGECLLKVCELTKTKDFQALFPSQHMYITYVGNLVNGLKLNSSCLRLVSIVFSGIPQVNNCPEFRPYVQLFRNGENVYNSLVETEMKSYKEGDLSCIFDLKGIELSDDILVRCKHFENNQTRVAMFRLMFNCAFVFDNVYRVWERELDKSYLFKVQKDFFIDFIFERGNQKSFQTADRLQQYSQSTKNSNQIIQQVVQECKGLVLKEKSICEGIQTNFNPILNSHEEVFSIGGEMEHKEKEEEKQIHQQQKQEQRQEQQQQQQQQQQYHHQQQQQQQQQQQKQQQQQQQQQQQLQLQLQQQQPQQLNQEQQLTPIDSPALSANKSPISPKLEVEEPNRLSQELKEGEEDIEHQKKESEENKLVSRLLEKLDDNENQDEDDDEDIEEYLNKLEQSS